MRSRWVGVRAAAFLFCVAATVFACGPSLAQGQRDSWLIGSVRVTGNTKTEESLVLWTSGLKPGGRLSAEVVQEAVRNLYRLGVFEDIQVYTSPGTSPGEVTVELRLKELPSLARLDFRGNKKIGSDELRKAVKLVEGQMLSPKGIVDSHRAIQSKYEEKGYTLARVNVDTTSVASRREVNLVFRIEEGERVQVKGITFHGNHDLTEKELRKQMKTREDRWYRGADYKDDVFKEDLKLIEAFYHKKGYKDARVVTDSLSYGRSRKDLFVDITVEEGDRYTFGAIEWKGNQLLASEEIKKQILARTGEPFDQELYGRSYNGIVTLYGERGYLNARIVPEESTEKLQVNIAFAIDEGMPSRVKTIAIEGNTKTKDFVIRRELSLKPGQVFKQSAWERSIRDVYQLNFFKNVEQDRQADPDGNVDMILRVEERSTGTASMGAGYSDQDHLIGTAGLTIPNLAGNGQALDFNWEFGGRRKTFRLGFTEPWLFNSPTMASLSVYHQRRFFSDTMDYLEEGGSLGIGRRVSWPDNYSHISGSFRFERYKEYGGSLDGRTSNLGLTYRRDSRDLPMFPTRGSRVSYTPELSTKLVGSTGNYQKHVLEADFYVPGFLKFVLRAHAKVGAIGEFKGTSFEDIPRLERFTPGGVDFDGMVRGYSDRSIGPRDTLSVITPNPDRLEISGSGDTTRVPVAPDTTVEVGKGAILGGNMMTVFNLEYQFPVVHQQVYGLLFADAGNAWRHPGDVSLGSLKKSVGFGVRVMAPMLGLIGFDFAYGFDPPAGEKRQWRTHFQFGAQFN